MGTVRILREDPEVGDLAVPVCHSCRRPGIKTAAQAARVLLRKAFWHRPEAARGLCPAPIYEQ